MYTLYKYIYPKLSISGLGVASVYGFPLLSAAPHLLFCLGFAATWASARCPTSHLPWSCWFCWVQHLELRASSSVSKGAVLGFDNHPQVTTLKFFLPLDTEFSSLLPASVFVFCCFPYDASACWFL